MKRGDRLMLIAFAVILALSAALFAARLLLWHDGLTAEILQNGRMTRSIKLDSALPEEFTLTGASGSNLVRVERGRIAVISADCPDKDCVKRGWLSRRGDGAVCLPNRLSIRITAPGKAAIDGTTY